MQRTMAVQKLMPKAGASGKFCCGRRRTVLVGVEGWENDVPSKRLLAQTFHIGLRDHWKSYGFGRWSSMLDSEIASRICSGFNYLTTAALEKKLTPRKDETSEDSEKLYEEGDRNETKTKLLGRDMKSTAANFV